MAEKKKAAEKKEKKPLSEGELIELLGPRRDVRLKIEKVFQEMKGTTSIIVKENLKEYNLLNVYLLKKFSDKGTPGVYVTLNKSLTALNAFLEKEQIDTSKNIFIDAISRLTGAKEAQGSSFVYVDSPKNLIEINMAIEEAVEGMNAKKIFVIIDSVSTLLVYNKEKSVEKLVHSLTGKMKDWNAQAIFVAVESTNMEIINTLTQFCDKMISV
jgi:KaiC/GvpD/RAD55 family RecA-like ATPase